MREEGERERGREGAREGGGREGREKREEERDEREEGGRKKYEVVLRKEGGGARTRNYR